MGVAERIAVLGATGVYGRHLVPRLVARGYTTGAGAADMADATVAALDRWPSCRTLIVADDEPAPWRDVFTYVAAIAGARRRRRAVASDSRRGACAIAARARRSAGRPRSRATGSGSCADDACGSSPRILARRRWRAYLEDMATDASPDRDRLERLRRRLVDERNVLAHRIDDAQRAADVTPEAGEDDQAADSELVDDALTFGSRYTERQHAIDDALARMDRGDYGVCEVCGNPIEPERLDVEPTARLCADDARRADRRPSPSL